MPEKTDVQLVQLVLAGQDSAFAEIVARYQRRAFGTASRYARGKEELNDLAQEIFIRVWKGLKTFRQDAPFEHWFMKICIRTCYDFLRKHRRRRESEVLTDQIPERTGGSDDTKAMRSREAWEIIERLMEQLNDKDRMIVTLLELEERSVKEIAELTGWSVSNVKVRAHRARKKLQALYQEQQETI